MMLCGVACNSSPLPLNPLLLALLLARADEAYKKSLVALQEAREDWETSMITGCKVLRTCLCVCACVCACV